MTTRQDRVETVEQILYGSTLPTRAAKAYAARIVDALDVSYTPPIVDPDCPCCLSGKIEQTCLYHGENGLLSR